MARALICDVCQERACVCVVTMTETGDVFAFCGTDLVVGLAAMLGQLTGFDVARVLNAGRDQAVEAPQDAEGTDTGGEVAEAGSVELEAVDGDLAAAFAAGVAAAIEAGMTEQVAGEFVAEAFAAGLNPFDVLEAGGMVAIQSEHGPDDDQDDDQDETPEVQSFASEDSLGSGAANAIDMSGVTAEIG